jgi:Protein of unknown function (DUF551).
MRLIDADALLDKMQDYGEGQERLMLIDPYWVRTAPTVERPHGEWISCSERLPEESGQYYVSGGDKVWICSFLIIPTFKGGWCNNVSNPVVEAWMPLPEPYKRGEAE